YTGQQAASDAETLRLYKAYAQTGDSAQGRQFARQATPMLQDEFDGSASLAMQAGRSEERRVWKGWALEGACQLDARSLEPSFEGR
ncbi:hypothetical protein MKK84_02620, partial [Methylobacterium sp. E-065]|nr:hypothetical protein [Methylobacterium sp. E-065]